MNVIGYAALMTLWLGGGMTGKEALDALNKYRNDLQQEAIKARDANLMSQVAEKVAAKANELIGDMDPASVDAKESLDWSMVFASTGYSEKWYFFFHAFAPIRFFEFLAGILLARLFQINDGKTDRFSVRSIPGLSDVIVTTVFLLIYLNLRLGGGGGPGGAWVADRAGRGSRARRRAARCF